jgi:hypothetical protein
MEKYIKDGKVAVLISPGYGAGWYSWNTGYQGLLFDPEIVQAVLDGNRQLAAEIADRKYPDCYTGGARDLTVEWLDPGTVFTIDDYDGYESLEILGCRNYLMA